MSVQVCILYVQVSECQTERNLESLCDFVCVCTYVCVCSVNEYTYICAYVCLVLIFIGTYIHVRVPVQVDSDIREATSV